MEAISLYYGEPNVKVWDFVVEFDEGCNAKLTFCTETDEFGYMDSHLEIEEQTAKELAINLIKHYNMDLVELEKLIEGE